MPVTHSGFTKVQTQHLYTSWKAPRKLEETVEKVWEQKIDAARRSGVVLFNGPAIRARTLEQAGSELLIYTQPTDYKHHVVTRENKELRDRANILYAAAIIRVWDDGVRYQVFGVNEGGSEAAGLGKLNVIAGAVQPSDIDKDRQISIETALYREMKEEIGLLPQDCEVVQPGFVVNEDHWQHPSIVYIITTRIGREAILERHKAVVRNDREEGRVPEHGDIVFLPDKRESLQNNQERFEGRVHILQEFYSTQLK